MGKNIREKERERGGCFAGMTMTSDVATCRKNVQFETVESEKSGPIEGRENSRRIDTWRESEKGKQTSASSVLGLV